MEKLQDRATFALVTDTKNMLKAVAKPNFVDAFVLNENAVITKHSNTRVYMDRPCYIGVAVLDLARLVMAKFHHNFLDAFQEASSVRPMLTGSSDPAYRFYKSRSCLFVLPHNQKIARD